jgi:hypothetical protein
MTRRQERMHRIAADIVAECGPYARMAALFLADEKREEGDADGTILWTRVAALVENVRQPLPVRRRLN